MKTKKCRPVLIETSKDNPQVGDICANSIGMFIWVKEYTKYDVINTHPEFENTKVYKLILISLEEDENIEVGDKCYHPSTGLIDIIKKETLITYSNYKFKTTDEKCWICDLTNETKKVIATQSQISSEYITRFVDQYNNGKVEDLEIKITNEPQSHKDIDKLVEGTIYLNQPKLTNGFITIIENKKPILYTEEEVYKLFNLFRKDFSLYRGIQILDVQLKGWLDRNKKK